MMNQSFRQVWVTNTPALLASGATVENIAVGQIGILDAKTFKATTTPTYANNKAIELVHGTPDLSGLPKTFGPPNQNEYSKLIKGKLLKDFRAKGAQRGQQEVWTLGWSGDPSDTQTLSIKPGEKRQVAITLTGGFIDKLYSTQGLTRTFSVVAPGGDDCVDPCSDVDCNVIIDDLLKQISRDKDLKKFIRPSKLISCNPALTSPATNTDYVFQLTISDTQDQYALSQVQAQYPNDKVSRVATSGITSTYQIVRDLNTTPTAASTSIATIINDCDVCPTGYTLVPTGFAYKITRNDAGDATAKTAVNTSYSLGGSEINNRVSYEYGLSTYVVVSTTALTVVAGDTLQFLGKAHSSCVITSPTTVAWAAAGTVTKYAKAYELVVADDICGNDRLLAIQAAYPTLTVAIKSGSTGPCLHTYTTSVFSTPVATGTCSPEQATYVAPGSFEGIEWTAVPPAAVADGTACLCGIRFDVAVVNRKTNECTFDAFPFDIDTVHLTVSEFNEEYSTNDNPKPWVGRKLQGYKRPQGSGEYIQRLEKDSLMYAGRFRSSDAVVREIEQYEFQARSGKFYDEYVLEFEFEYKVGGWSNKYTDSYQLFVYVPEGTGQAFENAINGYVSSVGIMIDPVQI